MLTLLLGPDDFSKNEHILALAKQSATEVEICAEPENLPAVQNLTQADLFSKPKIYVLKNLTAKLNSPENLEKFIASKNHIIFWEEKLDKRNADNKKLLAHAKINIQEFNLPRGQELNRWLLMRAKYYQAHMSPEAAEILAVFLGRDNAKETKVAGKIVAVEEVYNLWQADSEIKKLADFAAGREITPQDVKALAAENGEVDVFELTNAVADGQKLKAVQLLQGFLSLQSGSDEKGSIIQLNALLSEQFRNVLMVQDFLAQKKSEAEILEATGWKSGRLFVMKKISGKFAASKVLDFLNKLKALDEELKTSATPPRVLLDLIISQLF